eukprot:TRINITY_DN14970_c0_g1_i1.p3 TRINITY_DN14970_c0_g1~~TRINITY_DN14970_c0_g1_i1.p3  ORF type:complete len:104 (-),score=2.83 TRINITY_DN14970_c0_g1_i1:400-711(-)
MQSQITQNATCMKHCDARRLWVLCNQSADKFLFNHFKPKNLSKMFDNSNQVDSNLHLKLSHTHIINISKRYENIDHHWYFQKQQESNVTTVTFKSGLCRTTLI